MLVTCIVDHFCLLQSITTKLLVFFPAVTARELLKMFGCSQRLYNEVFEPAIQASLFALGEQCSAAAALGMWKTLILYVPWGSRRYNFLSMAKVTGIKRFNVPFKQSPNKVDTK